MEGKPEIARKNMEFLSVEIGVKDLKIARVRVNKGEREILAIKSENIANDADAAISQKIIDIISAMKGAKRSCVLNVIPSNLVIFKNIEIPSTDENEIEGIIDLQAGRHTPYSREEIILDHINLGVAHDAYSKILLAIVKKDLVTRRYQIIKGAGLVADRAVLPAEAIIRFYAQSSIYKPAGSPGILVNLDNDNMDFIIEKGGEPLYIRSVLLDQGEGGDQLMEGLKSSLESYQTENIDVMPDKMYITGSVGKVHGKEEEIRKSIGVNCSVVHESNFLGMDRSKLSSLQGGKEVSVISVVTSAEVSDSLCLNLIPEDVKIKNKLRKKASLVARVGLLAIVSLVVFSSIFLMDMVFKKLYLKRLKSAYTAEIREAGVLKRVANKSDQIESFLESKGRGLAVLTELINALPPEVYINSLNLQEDNTLVFNGTADTMSRVFSIVTSLENNKNFSNVKVDSTRSRRVEGQEVADFGLTLSVKEEL